MGVPTSDAAPGPVFSALQREQRASASHRIVSQEMNDMTLTVLAVVTGVCFAGAIAALAFGLSDR